MELGTSYYSRVKVTQVLSLVQCLHLRCTTNISGSGVVKYTWLFGHFVLPLSILNKKFRELNLHSHQ
jgi:hypothetical protein